MARLASHPIRKRSRAQAKAVYLRKYSARRRGGHSR